MNGNRRVGRAASWPLFRAFQGWRPSDIGPDAVAGVTLAAIAIPEQMATAGLGHFEPQIGFLAIIAGAIAFAIFGANRALSVGADSTITPIFAGSLTEDVLTRTRLGLCKQNVTNA